MRFLTVVQELTELAKRGLKTTTDTQTWLPVEFLNVPPEEDGSTTPEKRGHKRVPGESFVDGPHQVYPQGALYHVSQAAC